MFAQFITASGQNRTSWAARLGISPGYLSDLLNGNKTPSLDLAVQIERATGGAVPAISWIAEDTDAPAHITPSSDEAAA